MFNLLKKKVNCNQNSISWKNKDIVIILDNGHGKDCSGKCSPK